MSSPSDTLYPLKLAARAVEKVWGGAEIARRYRPDLPAGRPICELWAVWGELAVENGALRGRKLDDLARELPIPLLGRRVAARGYPSFPLLVKILDAREILSVQVHPDDAYAREREGEPFGKAEVWYILDAEPGASIIHGVAQPLSRAEVERAIEAGELPEKLAHVEVAPGDVVFNPAGTIHATGAGILLYELQQSSDLTYRFYDWERHDPNRPLHIDKSLDVADLAPYPQHKIQPVEVREPGVTRTYLCACHHFAAELLRVESSVREQPAGKCFHILTALEGAGRVSGEVLNCGDSVLVPASVQTYEVHAEEPLLLVKAYVPDLRADILEPLRQRGLPDEVISQLGGNPRHSDLARLL
jgi:mannose-6-phosphate isomerase